MAQLKDTTVDGILAVNGVSVNDALIFDDILSKCVFSDASATVDCKASSNEVIISYMGASVEHYEGQALINLPAGFRPDTSRYFTDMIGSVPIILRAYPDGDIAIWYASSYPTGRVYFSCVIAI